MGNLPSSPEQRALDNTNTVEKPLQQQPALPSQSLPSIDAQKVVTVEKQRGALARIRERLRFFPGSEQEDPLDQLLPTHLLTPEDLRIPENREVREEDLRAITESDRWKNLAPNYERQDALLPRDISPEQLQALIASISKALSHVGVDAGASLDGETISDLGTLSYLGSGERKQGLLLTTSDGKKMTVLVNNTYLLGLHIPTDPHLAFDQQYGAIDYPDRLITEGSYSTFRTYLSIPLMMDHSTQGIQLMEYGGKPAKKVDKRIIPTMIEYVRDRGFQLRSPEDASKRDKPGHFLSQPDTGTSGIIDIGVYNLYQGEEEIKTYYRRILRE